jgi:hypothetical protein
MQAHYLHWGVVYSVNTISIKVIGKYPIVIPPGLLLSIGRVTSLVQSQITVIVLVSAL